MTPHQLSTELTKVFAQAKHYLSQERGAEFGDLKVIDEFLEGTR